MSELRQSLTSSESKDHSKGSQFIRRTFQNQPDIDKKIFMKQKAVCDELIAPIIQSINTPSEPRHVKKIRGVRYNQRSFHNCSPYLPFPSVNHQSFEKKPTELA